MNLEKLQYFVDLVQSGNFTKTGAKNHVAQTSISQQIRSLENYFELQLIDRTLTPVVPTAAGVILRYTGFLAILVLNLRMFLIGVILLIQIFQL
ncbi:LysR family transcriptional regulator [Lactobacillus sp. DCY120]|uniref:LysR family transcriptional regulator n=1 Tax=Bombilactobacillus apium TaxID=2675299 RepID=A0A850QW54_9LACO|nr:LysR family transcriptional regulator [Bombilactobacillus apium]NVY96024.1 LysR family transcriptional regulator [Bombilactobacillus apium]